MNNKIITYVSLLLLQSCVTSNYFSSPKVIKEIPKTESSNTKIEKVIDPKTMFHDQKSILLNLSDGSEVNAEIFRPSVSLTPKTVVIIVPGSGNVSRFGEVNNDGLTNYETAVNQSELWAKALANKGLFVLSYDKRSCQKEHNPQCNTTSQKILNEQGIQVLANDVDSVCDMVESKLSNNPNTKIVLLSFAQGSQSIALSKCLNKASSVILISPIIKDLENTWVNGLNNASTQNAYLYKKNDLINQAESTKVFFASLKRGDFPPNANIRGASVIFWQSWIKAVGQTIDLIKESGTPTIFLFAQNDPFFDKTQPPIGAKFFNDVDRNLLNSSGLSSKAVDSVVDFIKTLVL